MTTANSNYSSAFPPLQAFPWTFPTQTHKKSLHKTSNQSSSSPISSLNNNSSFHHFTHTSFTYPKYPFYLKHTTYATLVTEQYQHLHNKRNSRLNSCLEYNRELEEIDLRLPQYWNKKDKSRHLEVGLNGFDLHYSTVTKNNKLNKEAAAIRTNFPMRSQCGVYYFEIRVISKGTDGIFAIGFCTAQTKLNTLPGCDTASFGYHGQDGTLSQQQKSVLPRSYGPSYISGDIIGCGVNFANGTAFFTKNGVSLGTAFEDVSIDCNYYPCVGLSTQGEKITANFGQEPFAFDIVQYIKEQQANSIKNLQKQSNEFDTKAEIDQLILSYLMHQGYLGAADALKKNMDYATGKSVKATTCTSAYDDETRGNIRKLIMSGHIDEAIEQTSAHYPGLLERNADLTFNLKARKFLEILINQQKPSSPQSLSSSFCLSDDDDDTLSTYSGRSRALSMSSINEEPFCGNHVSAPLSSPPLSVAASGRRLSWAAVAASPIVPQQNSSNNTGGDYIIGDDCHHHQSHHPPPKTRRRMLSFNYGRRQSFNSISTLDEEDDVITKAMFYGQQLQEEYQNDVKHLGTLMELFALLAYADPQSSPMAPLLDTCQRNITASELNDAIQAYQNHAGASNLELLYKQSVATSKELALAGDGKASLLFLQDYLH